MESRKQNLLVFSIFAQDESSHLLPFFKHFLGIRGGSFLPWVEAKIPERTSGIPVKQRL